MLSSLVWSLLAQPIIAVQWRNSMGWRPPPPSVENGGAAFKFHPATFSQWIDHDDKTLGTFKQHYCWSGDFYSGPGGPVVVLAPQENALGPCEPAYSNDLIFYKIAQTIGAGIVALEHRYYGNSSPYENITTVTAQYLTLSNSIADLVNFAKNAQLPFDKQGHSRPNDAPWILVGCSYSGALAAWTARISPGVYYAYYAGSAVVEAVQNFWTYFVPIIEAMPKKCSLAISQVVDHVDTIGKSGSLGEQKTLKHLFGLGALSDYVDFASALVVPIYGWQYGPDELFCKAVEDTTAISGANSMNGNVSLQTALQGYSSYFKRHIVPGYCQSLGFQGLHNIDCFNSHDRTSIIYTNTSKDSPINRQWNWFLCNEPFYWWPTGAPENRQTLSSRLVTADYFKRQCELIFPAEGGFVVGSAKGKTPSIVNDYTKGWSNVSVQRLNIVNSQFDPYREATVSSDFRPGGPLKSSSQHPIHIVSGGFHCSDVFWTSAPGSAQVASVKQIQTWVKEFVSYRKS